MKKMRGRVLASAVMATLSGVFVSANASAAEWVWNNPAGGNMNVASNWLPASVPANNPATELVFGATASETYLAVQNIASPPLQLNKLTFTTTSDQLITLGGTTANATNRGIRFAGTNPVVTHSGTGNALINSPLTFGADTTFNVTGTGILILSGNFLEGAEASAITKTGSGTLQWGDAGRGISNPLAGDLRILEGTLLLGNSGGSFIGPDTLVTVAAGAIVDIVNNPEDFGSLQGEGTWKLGTTNINVGQDDRSATWGGVIEGLGFVGKQGTGSWTLTNANTYSGQTRVIGGSMIFSGANGSANQSGSIVQSVGTTLTLDNTTGNNNDRLGDFAPITLPGSSNFNLLGNGTVDTAETIGGITATGATTITVTPGTGRAASLTSESLTRNPGGSVLFRGTGLGGSPGANVANILFTNTPTLVGGGGGTGTTSMSILPYALADASSTGLGNSLVTYDATTGIRPLNAATEYADYAAATLVDNVRIVGAAGPLAGKTINSLVIHNPDPTPMAVTGQAGTSLNPASGAMLFTGSGPITVGGFDALAFGDVEGIVSVASESPVTIASPITGNVGVTKNGGGTLVLTGVNPYFGGTAINAGTVQVNSDAQLGDAGGALLFSIGTLRIMNAGTLPRVITTNSNATLDSNGNQLELTGGVTGPGRLTLEGPGTYLLNSLNSHTGGTTIRNGATARVADGSALGSGGSITLDAGKLVITAPVTTARGLIIPAAGGTLDTGAHDMSIGAVSGVGHFTKLGTGILTLNASSPNLDGEWRIMEGTLRNGLTTANPPAQIDGQGEQTTVVLGPNAVFDDSFGNGETMGGIAGGGVVLMRSGVGYTFGNNQKSETFNGVLKSATDGVIGGAVTVMRKAGVGTWTIGGVNEYAGPTEIRQGTIKLAIDNSLPAPGPTQAGTRLAIGTPTSAIPGILELDGFDQGLAGLSVPTSNTAGNANMVVNSNAANPSVLTIVNDLAQTYTGSIAGNLSLVKRGTLTQTLGGANTYTGTTTVSEGTLNRTGTHTGAGAYTVETGATLESSNGIIAPSLTVDGTVAMKPNGTDTGTSDVGALVIGGATDAWNGKLDLADNDMVVRTAGGAAGDLAYANALNQARSGLNEAGGAFWAGNGITSSTAAANSGGTLTAVGIILNDFAEAGLPAGPIMTQFSGRTVGATDILMKYTYFGDADLSGVVDGTDYFLIDQAFSAGMLNGGWLNGDFNYDSKVDGTDYFLIDNAFGAQGAPLSGGSEASAVPEPSAMALLALGAGLLVRRRRNAGQPSAS